MAHLTSQLVSSLRGLIRDETGITFRQMKAMDGDDSVLIELLGRGTGEVHELTNPDLPGLHQFVVGRDGFDNWDWYL